MWDWTGLRECRTTPGASSPTSTCRLVAVAGSVYALGDASTVQQDKAIMFAEQLFKESDLDDSGDLDMMELRALFSKASERFPQFEEYAFYFEQLFEEFSLDDPRAAAVAELFGRAADLQKDVRKITRERVGERTVKVGTAGITALLERVDVNRDSKLNFEEFSELLTNIDKNLRSFPPTAQVAAQQGKYLAKLMATGLPDGKHETFEQAAAKVGEFSYFHKGSLAYLGDGAAAFDLPVLGPYSGPLSGVAWKTYETAAQVSWKNRALVGLDWIRTEVFGRSTSRI